MTFEVSKVGTPPVVVTPGTTWYAATTGLPGNTGAIGSPWDLATAFKGGPSNNVQPGDTILIRGGTYTGLWNISTNGSAQRPIDIKVFAGESVTIDAYVHTLLTNTMTNVQTTVPMAQQNFPDNTVINIGTESIRLHTGYSAGSYTGVDRAWNGTTAATHALNDPVDTDNGHAVTMLGTYTRLWYPEVTVSVARYANRVNPQAGSNPFGRPPSGIEVNGTGNIAIHCFVHDTTDGISTSAGSADNWGSHGNICQYIGWDASDRGHGHCFYFHNDNPLTSTGMFDGGNIALAAFDFNTQVFTGGSTLGNVICDGVISSQAGVISSFGPVTEFLFGFSPGPITSSTFKNCALYASGLNGFGLSWGYSGGGTDGCTLTNNYVAAQNTACAFSGSSTNLTTSGNVWIGPSSAPNPASGTFLSWKPPSGKKVVISKSAYEAGRAHIAVYNWDHDSAVSLDFSTFLNNGDTYVVRNGWNYKAAPLASGTWNGTPVSVTTLTTPATPVGVSAPSSTGPEFNVYIVSKT